MKAPDLICETQRHGARLWAEGNSLELDVPADFPDEIIALLRQHKSEVLAYLHNESKQPAMRPIPHLLAWASELAEQDYVLPFSVTFVETPLRKVTTSQVSRYARHYLEIIGYARLQQTRGGLGQWTPAWFRDREMEALGALIALKDAIDNITKKGGSSQ